MNVVRYQIVSAGVDHSSVPGILMPEPERWLSEQPIVNPVLAAAQV